MTFYKFSVTEDKKTIGSFQLFNIDGEPVTDWEINVDYDKLRAVLEEQIYKGVSNFMNGLRIAISHLPENYSIDDFETVEIFLAGNSSRSPIVMKMFEKCIEEIKQKKEENIKAKQLESHDFYHIYPPLGTSEANKIIFGDDVPTNLLNHPNCKTGVAFGLLDCSGNVKFVDEQIQDQEHIKFKYFVGRKRKKFLVPVLNPNNAYDSWTPLLSASSGDFDLYYTEVPPTIEGKGNCDISSALHIHCQLDEADENKKVYIRAINSDTIEYVVSTEVDLDENAHGEQLKLL